MESKLCCTSWLKLRSFYPKIGKSANTVQNEEAITQPNTATCFKHMSNGPYSCR